MCCWPGAWSTCAAGLELGLEQAAMQCLLLYCPYLAASETMHLSILSALLSCAM